MAFKLKLKDFDYKQFFLQRGEWIGLGVVLLIVVPVLLGGIMKIYGAGTAKGNADEMQKVTAKAEDDIRKSPVPADADKPPQEFFSTMQLTKVDPSPYYPTQPFYVASEMEDTRRRKPEILTPREFDVVALLGAIPGAIINKGPDGKPQVMVLHAKDTTNPMTKRFQALGQRPGAFSFGGGGGGDAGGGRPGRGGGGFGAPGMGGAFGGGGFGAFNRFNPRGRGAPTNVMEFLDLDKVSDSTHLALDLYPVRMVVVSASFPLKEQLAEFRRALRRRSLGELASMISSGDAIWAFRPPEIERRKFDRSGKDSGWEKVGDQIVKSMSEYLARAAEIAPEDAAMLRNDGVINNGLVMARPVLARGEYPRVTIPNLMRGVANVDRFRGESRRPVLSFKSKQLQNVGFVDPFNPTQPIGTADEKEEKKDSATAEKKDEEANPDEGDELSVPDFALVRFIDTTVEPGYKYQYRIKIKMRNPNYHKHNLAYPDVGAAEDIVAPDWTMTPTVVVPNETEWFAMDDKPDKDKMMVQIHRWIDSTLLNPEDQNTLKPIGDWTIWEKAPAHRGEYIGRYDKAELPEWKIDKEGFELAVNTKANSRYIAVDFSARPRPNSDEDPALLLDYSGNRATPVYPGSKKIVEDVPVEALVLTSDGRLVVRGQQDDFNNTERKDRLEKWQQWIRQVKTGQAGKNSNRLDLFNRQMIPGQGGARTGGRFGG
jgi:hypothetical protein